jgi:hypothetical protein
MLAMSIESSWVKRNSGAHHPRAYRALWQELAGEPCMFERRRQLDSWLKQHDHPLIDGERWERQWLTMSNSLSSVTTSVELSRETAFDWSNEYFTVVLQALRQGRFFSDAYQKQLYHTYIETGRVSLTEQERLHRRAQLAFQEQSLSGDYATRQTRWRNSLRQRMQHWLKRLRITP